MFTPSAHYWYMTSHCDANACRIPSLLIMLEHCDPMLTLPIATHVLVTRNFKKWSTLLLHISERDLLVSRAVWPRWTIRRGWAVAVHFGAELFRAVLCVGQCLFNAVAKLFS